jgi:hypothetical protein
MRRVGNEDPSVNPDSEFVPIVEERDAQDLAAPRKRNLAYDLHHVGLRHWPGSS